MPFTNGAINHAEQHNKFFMIMALVELPPELDSVRNKIFSGSIILDYETFSEQMLRLATSHDFGPVSTPSTIKSPTLASHYHGRGRNRGHGDQHLVHISKSTNILLWVQSIG